MLNCLCVAVLHSPWLDCCVPVEQNFSFLSLSLSFFFFSQISYKLSMLTTFITFSFSVQEKCLVLLKMWVRKKSFSLLDNFHCSLVSEKRSPSTCVLRYSRYNLLSLTPFPIRSRTSSPAFLPLHLSVLDLPLPVYLPFWLVGVSFSPHHPIKMHTDGDCGGDWVAAQSDQLDRHASHQPARSPPPGNTVGWKEVGRGRGRRTICCRAWRPDLSSQLPRRQRRHFCVFSSIQWRPFFSWLFPRVRGFWENVRQFIPRLRFFFFFWISGD